MIESFFDATVVQAHGLDDAMSELKQHDFDLVLVNRLLDRDGSSGMEVLRQIRDLNSDLKVMLITNFSEHQDSAVEAGAIRGFGKKSLNTPETLDVLRPFLS